MVEVQKQLEISREEKKEENSYSIKWLFVIIETER